MSAKWQAIFRGIICSLFILSGVAKLFPIWAFEKQLVDLGFFTWESSAVFARLIIGLELGIGFCFLVPHFTKRFVIPVTALLLVAFCIHLIVQMIQFGPMDGNCGCFGQLIPMTPLEAFLKNVATLVILYFLWKKTEDPKPGNFFIPLSIYLLSTLIVFIGFPQKSSEESVTPVAQEITPSDNNSSELAAIDSTSETKENPVPSTTNVKADTSQKNNPKPTSSAPKIISKYTSFVPAEFQVNQGEKIICLFLPGCEHCIETAKELATMEKSVGLPPVHILFMDEETFKINDFFAQTNFKKSYSVVSIPNFWKLMGGNSSTPGVTLLKDGQILQFFQGTGDEKFNAEKLKGLLKR
ncbi:MAG: putative thiol:disulfide oxidoreductase TlpB [Bacteroidota bacterium]